jgi:hypothetical protein
MEIDPRHWGGKLKKILFSIIEGLTDTKSLPLGVWEPTSPLGVKAQARATFYIYK